MADKAEIARINRLTFKELRNELANCKNNHVKESLVRHLMYIRYNQYIQKKNEEDRIKREHKKRQIEKIKKHVEEKYKRKELVNNVKRDDIFDDIDDEDKNMASLSELVNEVVEEEEDNLFDSRGISEYDRDFTNNNLMERLNSDITIRTNKPKIEKSRKDIIPPYSNEPGDNYASYQSAFKSSKNNFSNLRPNKKMPRN